MVTFLVVSSFIRGFVRRNDLVAGDFRSRSLVLSHVSPNSSGDRAKGFLNLVKALVTGRRPS